MRVVKKTGKVLGYSLVVCLCFEIALWLVGYRPYANQNYKIEASPNNPYLGDPDYGIALNQGDFSILLNDEVQFNVTHTRNGQRLVPGLQNFHAKAAHFYGCSFTYGYGVNDDETFAALLKQVRKSYNVSNHGVVGYGTIQSWLQLKHEDLKLGDEVILCFSGEHLKRNTLSPQYRSDLKLGFANASQDIDKKMNDARFPYLSNCDSIVRYIEWQHMYENYFLREYSSSINLIQTLVNHINENKILQIEVSEYLINKMHTYCQSKGVGFSVVCLDTSQETIAIEQNNPHLKWVNVDFDFRSEKYTNLPYDSHPNKEGHQLISSVILNAIFFEK